MSRRRFAQKRMAEKKEDGMKASEGRKWRWKARVSEGRGRKAKERSKPVPGAAALKGFLPGGLHPLPTSPSWLWPGEQRHGEPFLPQQL